MFNFHKPRVYRSADGCCICRAKSSSSRFTASRKYEKESMQCFNLNEPRNGEICNACVLLVKRYKRLPIGSKRHWGHVVDARAGPGTKSMAKQKKRDNADAKSRAANGSGNSFLPEKFAKNRKSKERAATEAAAARPSSLSLSTSAVNRPSSTSPTSDHQHSDSNESYDDEQTLPANKPYQTRKRTAAAALATANESKEPNNKRPKLTGSYRRRQLVPQKNRRSVDNIPFFEENDLVRLEVCCGVVFQSLSLGSTYYIIDPELYKPCAKHQRIRHQQMQLQLQHQQAEAVNATPTPTTTPTVTTNSSPHTTQVQSKVPTIGPLKKHHLFCKRQSGSFPQGEIHSISPIPMSKTETDGQPLSPKPHSTLSLILKPTVQMQQQQPQSQAQSQVVSVGAASPSSLSSLSNCSTSSSVATKFNDNSSDSGFDEHVLERKSVSPPTDECKLRGTTGGRVQLILVSGLPLAGQSQNLMLAGNEFTARIVQQREAGIAAATAAGAGTGTPSTGATPLKINVLGGSQGNSNKMRAIFNSASSIQHENGVTTIVPASSLAASNQTAAMNAIAPSTVTITPSSVGKKVTVPNPKFILLKPAKFVGPASANEVNTATLTAEPHAPPPPQAKIV
uniref:Uncharacterized protein, isoform A n=1 Tax=Drosophila melanogaster TaxID=7227 RepID=Q9W4F6_DROME|nr:uncharacterized protein Dmel_CG44774, isoform F [Drosophila melanogaster]NP_001259248.1 uncharacterized protein Dmel_CG44774, isoform G [Drosophila melanogaster]NP_001284874.1 uncharacterized protein Dmel_CG44774, isoform I [Drosophila melanogaster]NP_572199.2 uncharacterized protein Dmel_CG44774, isoform A [Drosophila melanogaster]NP_996350.1 uncharacterized protein Dmel_CG44774, isoform B [Drosophila melanogaster]AAF45997.2 uncharacterized protein Dmel_CG44774, isoform A [Drosophila melan|eukprot:NP_001259247.1 uncharacterized protein Dmel_CG44774, isoform F [Drosophila melanogaster]